MLKIVITGNRGEGKTLLATLICKVLKDADIETHLTSDIKDVIEITPDDGYGNYMKVIKKLLKAMCTV